MSGMKGYVKDIASISPSESEATGDVALDLFLRFASSCHVRTISNTIQQRLSPGRCQTEDARTICVAE
jgi:hypothetical protein